MRRATRPARSRGPAVTGPVLRTALPVLLCAALAVAFIWTRTRALGAAYELAAEQKRHDQLTSTRGQLQLEVEARRSPRVLEAWARRDARMAPPAPGAVLAAGPRSGAGRAGVDGDGHRPTPAEPLQGRAAAGARDASADAARDVLVPGARMALRGPSRAALGD